MVENAAILVVEDSEDDLVLIRRSLSQVGILNPILVAKNGAEAIEYLSGTGAFSDRALYPIPELILLDLQMPGIDGFQVLEWLRKQPVLNELPVVVLTAYDDVRSAARAYQLGARSFLVKPLDFQNIESLRHYLQRHWVGANNAQNAALQIASVEPPVPPIPPIPPLEPPDAIGGLPAVS